MGRYLARRLIQSVVVLLVVTGVIFVVLNVSGDPVRLLLPPDATPADTAILREAMGFDKPLPIRYLSFMSHALVLDFGRSTQGLEPALGLVLDRLPATLGLGAIAMAISVLVGLPLGIASAVWRGRFPDHLGLAVGMLGQSVPVFWIGIVLILAFSVNLGLLPPGGMDGWKSWILPGSTLGILLSSGMIRIVRTAMLDTLGKPYLTTATAKGLKPSAVVLKHALRNAAIPMVTQLGLQARSAVGGSVVTETVFAWPGLGRLIMNGVLARDYPVVEAGVTVFAVMLIAVNLATDIAYTLLNPRVTLD